MNESTPTRPHTRFIGGVWLLLMAATAISTWGVSGAQVPASIGVVTTLLIAAFKVRLVILHFMEVRDAPVPVRLYFEAWILLVTGAILGIYLVPPAGS